MTSRPFWSKAGEPATFKNPLVGDYSSGDGAGTKEVLAINNAAFVGPAKDGAPRKTAFHRGANTEGNGARYTVSPSMKVPHNEPASTTASSTRVVRSKAGRSSGTFHAGMGD